MNICVFGASSSITGEGYVTAVEQLCERLARAGHGLVFGAGASGLMGAAARGFKSGGGKVTGIVPRFFTNEVQALLFDCDERIYTETMAERKTLMEESSEAFLVTPGGIGTFEEFFEVLTLKQLGRHRKAIVVYNVNGYFDKLSELLKNAIDEGFLNPHCTELIFVSDDDDAIAAYLESYDPDSVDYNVQGYRY